MKIIFIGKPGSGKGTQSSLLSDTLGISCISVRDVVRSILESESHSLKQKMLDYTKSDTWKPLPDTVAAEIVGHSLEGKTSWVLDGFPRNISQAKILNLHPDVVILINITDEESIARLVLRGREDDVLEKISDRLHVDQLRLPQLVEHYRSQGILFEFDGLQSVEYLHNQILEKTKGGIK